jgi:hypothetical protein
MNTNKRRMMMMMNQLREINTHPKTDFRLARGVCFLFKKKKETKKKQNKGKKINFKQMRPSSSTL